MGLCGPIAVQVSFEPVELRPCSLALGLAPLSTSPTYIPPDLRFVFLSASSPSSSWKIPDQCLSVVNWWRSDFFFSALTYPHFLSSDSLPGDRQFLMVTALLDPSSVAQPPALVFRLLASRLFPRLVCSSHSCLCWLLSLPAAQLKMVSQACLTTKEIIAGRLKIRNCFLCIEGYGKSTKRVFPSLPHVTLKFLNVQI